MIRTKIKTLLFSLSIVASGSVIAQPELTIPADTIFAALDTLDELHNGEISVHWDVTNGAFGDMVLMCSRHYIDVVSPYNYPFILSTEENPVAGSYEKFCWGPLCYNYGTDASSTNSSLLVTIPSNSTDTSFIAYFYPKGIVGTSTLEYCFHPVDNPGIGTCGTITYVITETANVESIHFSEATISSVYPNPLEGEGWLDYSIPVGKIGRVIARDITGKLVATFEGLSSEGRVVLDATEFSQGLFFTTLEINGIAVSTKRFVVVR
jgi:hypothetical protein